MGTVILTSRFPNVTSPGSKQNFTAACDVLIRAAGEAYAAHPGMHEDNISYLRNGRYEAHEKIDFYIQTMKGEAVKGQPDQEELVRILMAGVLVFERIAQCTEWLRAYNTLTGLHAAAWAGELPALNVPEKIGEAVYETIIAETYPPAIQTALEKSAELYDKVSRQDALLKAGLRGREPAVVGP